MTPAQREAALLLAEGGEPSNRLTQDELEAWADDAAALLRELAAEPGQEPVAWHVCSVNSDGSLSLEYAAAWEEAAHEHINDAINEHDIEDAASWVVRPVYAAPQQRQPLTDEQIYAAISDQVFWATSKKFIVRVVRDVERAHGIVEAP